MHEAVHLVRIYTANGRPFQQNRPRYASPPNVSDRCLTVLNEDERRSVDSTSSVDIRIVTSASVPD